MLDKSYFREQIPFKYHLKYIGYHNGDMCCFSVFICNYTQTTAKEKHMNIRLLQLILLQYCNTLSITTMLSYICMYILYIYRIPTACMWHPSFVMLTNWLEKKYFAIAEDLISFCLMLTLPHCTHYSLMWCH